MICNPIENVGVMTISHACFVYSNEADCTKRRIVHADARTAATSLDGYNPHLISRCLV